MIIIQADYICEYCYKPASDPLPDKWELVWQSAVCPDCWQKVQDTEGGIQVVPCGFWSFIDDPRAPATQLEVHEQIDEFLKEGPGD